MTTVELERIAQGVIPPVGATGWRITVTSTAGGRTTYAVVPILFGRLDGKPVFSGGQADCRRFHDLLEGRPASRRTPRESAGGSLGAPVVLEGLTEAPVADASSDKDPVRLCAGCDEPLPAGARPNRLTHNAACRQRAQYRRDAFSGRADGDGGLPNLTLSDRSEPDGAPRSADDSAGEGDVLPAETPADRGALTARSSTVGAGEALPPGAPAPAIPTVANQPRAAAVPAAVGGDQLALPLAAPSG